MLAVLSVIVRLVKGAWPGVVTTSAHGLAAVTWSSAVMITATIVIGVLGLILIIAALKPGHTTTAQLAGPQQNTIADTDYVISRRAIARLAAAQADGVDGVERVSTSATGTRVHLSIVSPSEQTDQIRSRVVDSVTQTLQAAGLDPMPRIIASVRTQGDLMRQTAARLNRGWLVVIGIVLLLAGLAGSVDRHRRDALAGSTDRGRAQLAERPRPLLRLPDRIAVVGPAG